MNEPLGLGSRLSVNEQQLHEHCELWSTVDTSCVLQSTENKPGKQLWACANPLPLAPVASEYLKYGESTFKNPDVSRCRRWRC